MGCWNICGFGAFVKEQHWHISHFLLFLAVCRLHSGRMTNKLTQNFTVFFLTTTVLIVAPKASIIVIVSDFVSYLTAQPNEFLVWEVEQGQMVHSLEEVKLHQVGQSCSKVATYTLRWYVHMFGLDQLLVTGLIHLSTGDSFATVCSISGYLVIISTCCITHI